ncbi:MAG: hypothetical protein ACTHYN_02090, partial [Marinobacter sp.]
PSAEQEPSAEKDSSALPVPLWVIGAIAGGLVILALFIIVLMRRRRNAEAAVNAPDDNLEDLQQDMADVEAQTPVLIPEPEDEPAEEDIPIASTVVEPEEPEETIPELTEPADDNEEGENGEEEEFGLDDFDLSEFDDLPDFDSSDEPEKGGNSDDQQKK